MSEWSFAVDEQLSKDILKLDTWQAFEFVMAQFYFAGQFDAKIPTDWGRYMTEQILAKQPKD